MNNRRKRKKKQRKKFTAVVLGILLCLIIAFVIIIIYIGNEKNESDSAEKNDVPERKVESVDNAGKAEIIEKADASYEKWLAAATVTAISMEYEDFTIDKIYVTGETDVNSKADSQGVFVVFSRGDQQIAIASKPLEAERTEVGTVDLYTKDLGFASYDEIEVSAIDTGNCQSITMDEISELISQSILVSLYQH